LCVSSITREQITINPLTRINVESTVLFGDAEKVMGICSEKKTRTLASQVDSPP
jgi:hypothetical protein